jgi:hypothetical protein
VQVYVETGQCRAAGAEALAAVEHQDGGVNFEELDDTDTGPLTAYAAEHHNLQSLCTPDTYAAYSTTREDFDKAEDLYYNHCTRKSCDEDKLSQAVLDAIADSSAFKKALNRKAPRGETDRLTPGTLTLHGSLRLYESAQIAPDEESGKFCYGTGGFGDIYAGTQVTVTDADGKKVALGELDQGTVQGTRRGDGAGLCQFEFTVADMPDKPGVFTLQIGDRAGAQDFTIKQYLEDSLLLEQTLNFKD